MPGSRSVAHQLTTKKHRETQKLHNSWNCCTNSRARPSGLTSDHSRHCWEGGNWLWDMPTGSEGRIGNTPCRSQICAQDPNSWPEAAARQRLHWTSSAHLRWWNLFVQSHHWWWGLGGFTVAILRQSNNPLSRKAPRHQGQIGQTGENQCQEHDHQFFDFKGIVHKEFVPTGQTVNSGF